LSVPIFSRPIALSYGLFSLRAESNPYVLQFCTGRGVPAPYSGNIDCAPPAHAHSTIVDVQNKRSTKPRPIFTIFVSRIESGVPL